jgi:hypothetical protein
MLEEAIHNPLLLELTLPLQPQQLQRLYTSLLFFSPFCMKALCYIVIDSLRYHASGKK